MHGFQLLRIYFICRSLKPLLRKQHESCLWKLQWNAQSDIHHVPKLVEFYYYVCLSLCVCTDVHARQRNFPALFILKTYQCMMKKINKKIVKSQFIRQQLWERGDKGGTVSNCMFSVAYFPHICYLYIGKQQCDPKESVVVQGPWVTEGIKT